jgi:hypothetical protein
MSEYKDFKSKIDLRAIKSSYITKRIFSFLYEKQKMKMIRYSKELQKIFLIDIEDYKKISGKYKIGVTTNIRIAHNSIGELKPTWYQNREIINNRWGDKFPIDILKK